MKTDAKFSHASPIVSVWANYLIILCITAVGSFGGFLAAQEVMMKGGQGYVKPAVAGTDYLDPSAMSGYQTLLTTGTANQYFCGDKTWQSRSFNNAPSHTIQTVAAAGNGYQLSTTRDAFVVYPVAGTTTSTIGGASTALVVLEICPTNSAVAANWITLPSPQAQTITLALVLQSVQVIPVTLVGLVPAGYYCRVRSTAGTGTNSVYGINSSGASTTTTYTGQEMLF